MDTPPQDPVAVDPVEPDAGEQYDPAEPVITEPVRAPMAKGQHWRLGLIALMCTAFGLWFVYDGSVTYPEQMRQYKELLSYQEANPNWNSDPEGWQAYAQEKNLNPSIEAISKHNDRTQGDVTTQFIMAGLTLPIGLWFLYGFARSYSRFVAADTTGLTASGGKSLAWDNITDIENARWKKKGIAAVKGKGVDGKEVEIVLDDWKYEVKPTNLIYQEALRRHDPEAYVDERIDAAARAAAAAMPEVPMEEPAEVTDESKPPA